MFIALNSKNHFIPFQVRRFQRLCPVPLLNNLSADTLQSRSNDPTPSTSVGNKSYCVTGGYPWQNTSFGWLPSPQNPRHKVSDELLKECYSAVQNIPYYKDPAPFKTAFKDEEIRRNNFTKCVESYQEKLNLSYLIMT